MTRKINERELRALLNELRDSAPRSLDSPDDADGEALIASGEPIISLSPYSKERWPERTAETYREAPDDATPGRSTNELDERTQRHIDQLQAEVNGADADRK